jgi:hypothetical protein
MCFQEVVVTCTEHGNVRVQSSLLLVNCDGSLYTDHRFTYKSIIYLPNFKYTIMN